LKAPARKGRRLTVCRPGSAKNGLYIPGSCLQDSANIGRVRNKDLGKRDSQEWLQKNSKEYEPTETISELPNVLIEWLALLPRTQEVPGSDFGPETGYPHGFCDFSQSSQTNSGIVP
jgi:hypothetical protein